MSEFNHHDQTDQEDLPPSKSSVKREAERLKKIGEQLLQLSDSQLGPFPLTEKLILAIAEGKRMKSREGLRRHKQYIGKLLRDTDTAAIEARINDIENAHTLNTQAFHKLETLRDELINGDNTTIGEVIARFPGIDTQKLRQLVRNSKKEQLANQQDPDKISNTQGRKLFRFLRDLN
jgi:ribosome-associated protein